MIKKISLFIIILLFSILSLNITDEIKNNKKEKIKISNEELDISFTKVILNNQDITETSLQDNNKTISFVINNIKNTTNLTYQINNNTDKDISINVKCNNTKQYNDYYTFNNNYNEKLLKQSQLTGTITFNILNNNIQIKDMFMCKIEYK